MIIQGLLFAAFCAVLAYSLTQRRRAPVLALAMVAMSFIGGLFVLVPDLTNTAAHLVGVGRGADLILYCFIVLMLVAVFNIHLRLRAERETITELARGIALLAATKHETRK